MFVLNRWNENESDHHCGSSSGSMVGDYHKPPAVGSYFRPVTRSRTTLHFSGEMLAMLLNASGYMIPHRTELARMNRRESIGPHFCATVGPAFMMITIPELGCDHGAIVGVLVVAKFLNGAYYGGSFLNSLDLGPNYAGSIAAFASTFTSTVQFVAPMLAGILTDKNTLSAWNTVFYISAAMTSLPVILYFIFGSTDEQPWNKIDYCKEVANGNEKYVNCNNQLIIDDGKCNEIIKRIGNLKHYEKEEK
uniref:(California timema) hypothetical protein n=1 Tax=Timema californicum TaxID=61474 RepID=A0A7R9J144_TIMCA|nr:unnamed protein product [Timema californicum]